jgi:tRNA 2-selenouridine synthase
VSGLAGAGKTELLRELERAGEQVLDLEALACHRGSAFGAIGVERRQPSHPEFGRAVEERVRAADPRRVLWVEDEGPFLGSVGLPPWLAEAIACAPALELATPFAARVDRLAVAYATAGEAELLDALGRSRPRLGAGRADAAAALVAAGDVRGAVEAVLPWFDEAYRRRTAAYRRDLLARLSPRCSAGATPSCRRARRRGGSAPSGWWSAAGTSRRPDPASLARPPSR